MSSFVSLIAGAPRGALYVGVTCDLVRPIWQDKNKVIPGFAARYWVDRLVWFEVHSTAEAAIRPEKHIKKWEHDWKINLIERDNPFRADPYPAIALP